MSKDYSNPLIKRYPPNSRFLSGEFKNQVEIEIRKDEPKFETLPRLPAKESL